MSTASAREQERPTGSGTERVVLAALTYRRPDDLAVLLPLLVEQAGRVDLDVEVVVVDNDPAAGAREQVTGYGRGVRYVHAPEPGIAAARNVALEAAVEARLLVFIDDDERPVAGWLGLLLDEWRRTRPAAVVGPVVSQFAAEPSPWVQAGRFFDRRRLRTGSTTSVAATNNLLLDLAFVRAQGLRFDARFGLSGGSDTFFTRQLTGAGGRIVWCDEAVVTDVVPAARVTAEWVLRRAYRSGNGWACTSVALAGSAGQRLLVRAALVGQGVTRLAGGALRLGLGVLLLRRGWQARGVRTMARGAGMVSGAAGVLFVEYGRPPVRGG